MKLHNLLTGVLVAGALLFVGVNRAKAAVLSTGPAFTAAGTYSIDFGDPNKSGTQTTTVEVKYTDGNGVVQKVPISANTPVTAAMDEHTKKEAVQANLNTAINSNLVNGHALLTTGGTGDVMTITPGSDASGMTDVKIKSVTTSDKGSGETDTVTRPASPSADSHLAQVTTSGEIAGVIGDRRSLPANFTVVTSAGNVLIPLQPGMTKATLMDEVETALQAMGFKAWAVSDPVHPSVFVLMDDPSFLQIGVGTTDFCLEVSCSVTSR